MLYSLSYWAIYRGDQILGAYIYYTGWSKTIDKKRALYFILWLDFTDKGALHVFIQRLRCIIIVNPPSHAITRDKKKVEANTFPAPCWPLRRITSRNSQTARYYQARGEINTECNSRAGWHLLPRSDIRSRGGTLNINSGLNCFSWWDTAVRDSKLRQ